MVAVNEFPHVILSQDDWDDYGYQTTFTATLNLSGRSEDLGVLRILHEDQTGGFTPMPELPFPSLGSNYCSMGGSLEYYEKLYALGRDVYDVLLRGLSDITYDDVIRARFEDKEGYKVSLMRISGAQSTIADAGRLLKEPHPLPRRPGEEFEVNFKTQLAENATPFVFRFDFKQRGALPNRMNALIGYNGTGKTRLLSNLAIVASGYGLDSKEEILAETAGGFVGYTPPFKTVVVVSYSAFDTFVIPGKTKAEKERLTSEGDIFGYVYCGLREHANDDQERVGQQYRLRTPQEIENEFLAAVSRIRSAQRLDSLAAILQPLLQDASFQQIGINQFYVDRSNEEWATLFRSLSSGHKVVLKIVVDLAAYMHGKEPTLVLIDEPETHLHPPLLAAMLKSVRACLQQFDGYAIVATHSPVVLQETPSRYVHVLRRKGTTSSINKVSIETFGENVGVITQEVFNLDDGSTDWHDTLRQMAEALDLEEMEKLFGNALGFGARSYVVSLKDDNEE